MKKYILLILSLAFLAGDTVNGQNRYRWDVKILIDTAGHRVFKMAADAATIQELAANSTNPRPSNEERSKGKRAKAEKRKVTVTAFIIADGKEDDGDYHLVLKNTTGNKSLIGEIPDPAEPKLHGFKDLKKDYLAARKFIDDEIGTPPGSVKPLDNPVKVKVTGVVFFDKTAHGNGHAENGAEIHPILKIRKVN